MSRNLYANRLNRPLTPVIADSEYEAGMDGRGPTGACPAHPDSFIGTDDVQTLLHTMLMGITAGQDPLQFKRAIDTAQVKIGNRMIMGNISRKFGQNTHQVAQDGFRDSPQCYPYLDRIQQAFGGQHDISGLKAHTGAAAQAANARLGSRAFYKGGHVAFAGRPTLKEAAHEAAHGVQQAVLGGSLSLKGGVGEEDDKYERHADAVAQAVVRGESVEPLLGQVGGGSTEVAAAPITGYAPVQMMWPGLTRPGLSAMMPASVSRSGLWRNLLLNSRRHVWNKDILFGVDNGDTLDLAINQEAATDSIISRHRFSQLNKSVPPGFSSGYLWSNSGFDFADRGQLKRRDRPYMDYVRQAITTAMARGGNIYWALGHLHFDKVFSDLFRVQMEYGTDPVKYMAEVSFPELMDKHGKFIDASSGREVKQPVMNLNAPDKNDLIALDKFRERVTKGEIKNVTPFQPLITTTEIIGFLMGDERKYLDKTLFFDARHQKAEQVDFLSAYYSVLDQLLLRQAEFSPENAYKLEQPVYRPLDWYSGFPCGKCDEVFNSDMKLKEHWKRFPQHRP